MQAKELGPDILNLESLTLRTNLTNEEPVGEFPMIVELGKIREFARATGATDAAYVADETPVIPPTFLASSRLWQPANVGSPAELLGMNLERVVHGEQEFVYFGPLARAGARLRVEVRVRRAVAKEGRRGGRMRVGQVITDYLDEGGELLAQGIATLIELEDANE